MRQAMTNDCVRRFSIVAILAASGLPALGQQQGGEQVQGELIRVELVGSPRSVTIRTGGGDVTAEIANRTRIVFQDGNGELSDLKPGMQVRFRLNNPLERIQVSGPRPVKETAPTPAPRPTPRPDHSGGRNELKARLLSIDEDRGEIRADVAGRPETYRVEDRRGLRRFHEGDLVILVVEGRGRDEVVTSIRSAGVSGRVVRLDRRRGEVTVNVEGRDEVYGVDEERLLRDLREGERIRFEFEERSRGHKVITAVY